ncbi:hypothetical protein Tco_0079430 [Tanacetum coccineum]
MRQGGEGSRLATKRRKTAALKDGSAASEATSSPEPIRTINPTGPSGVVAEIAESWEDRSPRVSPRGSADHSVHNYSDVHHNNEEADTLRLGTSRDQSERAMTHVDTKVVQPCRLDTPMWCRELMVHLAPPTAQEESNALNNATALERAWFSLARGALAQTDILERFETLQADFGKHVESHTECGDLAGKLVQSRLDLKHSSDLYNSLSDRYKAFRSECEGCARKLEGLENRNRELSQVNKDQALRIKELEDTLAKKDSALVYAERINVERAQEKEKMVS